MTISEYREKKRLTLEELAAQTGLSKATISRACAGIPISRASADAINKGTNRQVPAAGLVWPRPVVS